MKAIQNKTSARATEPARKSGPFFGKDPGQGFFKPAGQGIQRKLTVGAPNDVYEKEADHMADRVVSGLQRKPIFESKNDPADGLQRKCAACEKEEKVQKKASGPGGSKASGPASSNAAPSVESGISRSKGSGSSLPPTTRSEMESSFGADFSGVKIHQDTNAQQLNKDLNAQAFTHGKDIYFDSGKYNPGNGTGKHLLAHELTHVVQQTGKVQRAPASSSAKGKAPCSLTPGSATIDQVTQQCPSPTGTITRAGAVTTITINKLQVKENADDEFLDKLTKPLTLPESGSRKENPTQQRKIWRDEVREAVRAKLKTYLSKINKTQSDEEKIKDENKYKMKLKQGSGFAALVGNYQNLVDQASIPKWSPAGVPQGFQVEHIVDYQIAGLKADDIVNLMLLNEGVNNDLGEVMARNIRDNIQTLLDHYNTYVPPNTLVTTAKGARKNKYTIMTRDFVKVKNPLPADSFILKKFMTEPGQDNKNPLKDANIEISAFDKPPKDYFILKSNPAAAGIILPYSRSNYDVGSYQLTMNGSEEKGITEIKAKLMINGPAAKDKPEQKTYKVHPLGSETKVFKADNFGYDMSRLKINYLSLVEFQPPELDEELNVSAKGLIATPGPAFISKTPIEVFLNGRDLTILKTFSASDLRDVGPIKVDDASLTLSLSTQNGLGASGAVDFSIPRVGKGHIDASKASNGFRLNGKFDFDSKTFDQATIKIGYSSAKDQEGSDGWTIGGTLKIGSKKVKGIESATITVDYAAGKMTLDGDAALSIPGLRSASIHAVYGGGEFSLGLKGNFDLKNKFIQDPHVTVTLATGGDDNSGFRLGLSGSLGLNIPHLNTVRIDVSYDQEQFDAHAKASDISVGKRITGSIMLGITNQQVDPATGAATGKGEGKELHLYGTGSITIKLNDNLSSTVAVRLTREGKVLVSGEVTLKKQPLLPGSELYGGHFELFKIATPKVPIFSIGVGSVFLQITGEGNAMYSIGVPLISADLNLKDTDIHDPAAMNIDATIKPEISAEAGVDLHGEFDIGAQVAILVVKAGVGGTLKLHAKATLAPSLQLSWSPDKGLAFKNAQVGLTGDINLAGDITGGVDVALDFWVKTINVWHKDWTLGSIDFGSLGKLNLNFPLNFGPEGNILPPSQLKPETPFSDRAAAEKWMLDKPGGAEKPVTKDVEEEGPSIHDILLQLPALGPTNPAYQQQRSRKTFYEELVKMTPRFDWSFVQADWYGIEQSEYWQLYSKLMQPIDNVDKLAVLHDFAQNHVMVPQPMIKILEMQITQMEQSTNQTQ
jgi:hypothetical protein